MVHGESTPLLGINEKEEQLAHGDGAHDASERGHLKQHWEEEAVEEEGKSVDVVVEKPKEGPTKPGTGISGALVVVLYGVINAVIACPVLYGYAAIIFAAPVYQAAMPALAKLVVFSSAVHQLSFTLISTLPFSIGQVQDAGLIFLGRITTQIAERLDGAEEAVVVSTALVTTAIFTAILGLLLVGVGKARMCRIVSYLPMPIIGGYLAFIGFFCLEAGLALQTGKIVNGPSTWPALLNTKDILLCIPGVVTGGLLTFISRCSNLHFSVLPLTIAALPFVFFALLGLSGKNLQDARDIGLVGAARDPAKFTEVFDHYQFDLVEWWVIPEQIPTFIAMVVVVAFSSTLDVAAIEMDMRRPVNINKELMTVGFSNFFAGLFGGFPGSYIFSQTIFTYRTHCHSRGVGMIVLLLELIVFFVSVDPMMYVPLFFFAATLIFIAFDLMTEWLVDVRCKLPPIEYLILLSTFVAIQIFQLNQGLAVGLCLALLNFLIRYVRDREGRTNILRGMRSHMNLPPSQRRLLQAYQHKILALELVGDLNFLSATTILDYVSELTTSSNSEGGAPSFSPASVAAAAAGRRRGGSGMIGGLGGGGADAGGEGGGEGEDPSAWSPAAPQREPKRVTRRRSASGGDFGKGPPKQYGATAAAAAGGEGSAGGGAPPLSPDPGHRTSRSSSLTLTVSRGGDDSNRTKLRRNSTQNNAAELAAAQLAEGEGTQARVLDPNEYPESIEDSHAPSFIVFDCRRLGKIDASAARSCFLPLKTMCDLRSIAVAYAGLTEEAKKLLRAYDSLDGERIRLFDSTHEAMAWCETSLIRALMKSPGRANQDGFWLVSHFGRMPSFKAPISIAHLLMEMLEMEEDGGASGNMGVDEESLVRLDDYVEERFYQEGEVIFEHGEEDSDTFYAILEGSVHLFGLPIQGRESPPRSRGSAANRSSSSGGSLSSSGAGNGSSGSISGSGGGSGPIQVGSQHGAKTSKEKVGAKTIFGYADFVLHQSRHQTAVSASSPVRLCCFHRDALATMLEEEPRLLALLQTSVLKHASWELHAGSV